MKRKPIVSNLPPRPEPSPYARMVVGEITSQLPGSSRLSARLSPGAGKAISNIIVADGVDFQAGDRVLLCRLPTENSWIALTKVHDDYEYGNALSEGIGAQNMHPPDGFVARGFTDMILVEWQAWPGATLCFEIQHNSSAAETNATIFYTRGSYFIYQVASPTTRYFRIRSLQYNVANSTTHYSGWSTWANASAPGPDLALATMLVIFDHLLDAHVVEGS